MWLIMKTITKAARHEAERHEEKIERTRRPTHPGEMLEQVAADLELSQGEVAKILRVGRRTVNELMNQKRGVTPEMALRLSRAFGSSPELWLGLQVDVDLWDAQHSAKTPEIELVRRFESRELLAA